MKIEGHQRPGRAQKEWAWSYSKLKNYTACPKRMYEVDVSKNFQDGGGEALLYGNKVHEVLAKALGEGVPLPAEMAHLQYWVDRVARGSGKLYVEQKYAITRDFKPTTYFAHDTWYRGIGDVVRVDNDLALVVDWKTGKVLEDSVQLMLMAQCLFSHFPDLKYVRSEFVWLKDECTTPELFTRQEVADAWVELLPRVKEMENSFLQMSFPPKPNRLCAKWCPVNSCPFHGKAHY